MSKTDQQSARQQVSVALDEAQVSRIDALAESSSTPWHKTSRAEVLRALVNQGLARVEESVRPRARRRTPRLSARRRGAKP